MDLKSAIKKIFFNLKLREIKNKNILIMHHQSLGLKATKKLINENDNIDFYIMDNAFFCIKSYNFLENEKRVFKLFRRKFRDVMNIIAKYFHTNIQLKII